MIPKTRAGKIQIIMELLGGQPIYDEYGNQIDETAKLITREEAIKLLNIKEEEEENG